MKDTMRSSRKNNLLELIDSVYGKSCSELGRIRMEENDFDPENSS